MVSTATLDIASGGFATFLTIGGSLTSAGAIVVGTGNIIQGLASNGNGQGALNDVLNITNPTGLIAYTVTGGSMQAASYASYAYGLADFANTGLSPSSNALDISNSFASAAYSSYLLGSSLASSTFTATYTGLSPEGNPSYETSAWLPAMNDSVFLQIPEGGVATVTAQADVVQIARIL